MTIIKMGVTICFPKLYPKFAEIIAFAVTITQNGPWIYCNCLGNSITIMLKVQTRDCDFATVYNTIIKALILMVVHSAKNAKRWETSQLCNAEIMQKGKQHFYARKWKSSQIHARPCHAIIIFSNVIDVLKASNVTNRWNSTRTFECEHSKMQFLSDGLEVGLEIWYRTHQN